MLLRALTRACSHASGGGGSVRRPIEEHTHQARCWGLSRPSPGPSRTPSIVLLYRAPACWKPWLQTVSRLDICRRKHAAGCRRLSGHPRPPSRAAAAPAAAAARRAERCGRPLGSLQMPRLPAIRLNNNCVDASSSTNGSTSPYAHSNDRQPRPSKREPPREQQKARPGSSACRRAWAARNCKQLQLKLPRSATRTFPSSPTRPRRRTK